MKAFVFECNNNTLGECISRQLFGSNAPWPIAKNVRKGDLCFLYNYSDHTIAGVWEAASDAGLNIVPEAWEHKYPYQIKVTLCSKEYQSIPRHCVEKTVRNGQGHVDHELFGDRAHNLLQFFATRYTSEVLFGVQLKSEESDYRAKYPANYHCSDGHKVRSLSEQTIDDWFSRHRVFHAYEQIIPIPEQLIPDFVLHSHDGNPVFVEYWGFPDDPQYAARMTHKCQIYAKYKFPVIELRKENLQNLDFVMRRKLQECGVPIGI